MKRRTLVAAGLALALALAPAAALAAGSSLAGWSSNGWSATASGNQAYESGSHHVSLYRLYNPYTGEHIYTTDANERNELDRIGWNVEGDLADYGTYIGEVGWFKGMASNDYYKPVYRLYNPYAPGGDHHYTTDKNEYDALQRAGWRGEGIFFWSATSQRTPRYRLYNPYAATGSHHYTMSPSERDTLISLGWRWEGVGWYAWGFSA